MGRDGLDVQSPPKKRQRIKLKQTSRHNRNIVQQQQRIISNPQQTTQPSVIPQTQSTQQLSPTTKPLPTTTNTLCRADGQQHTVPPVPALQRTVQSQRPYPLPPPPSYTNQSNVSIAAHGQQQQSNSHSIPHSIASQTGHRVQRPHQLPHSQLQPNPSPTNVPPRLSRQSTRKKKPIKDKIETLMETLRCKMGNFSLCTVITIDNVDMKWWYCTPCELKVKVLFLLTI